jgi:anti-sigma B factor antagonist
MALSISHRNVDSVTIIDLDGRITLGDSTGALREAIKKTLESGSKKLLLNMEKVSYVDSAGLGELVGIYTTATGQGGTAKLLKVQSKLSDLLTITKLHTIFEIYDDEAHALSSF